MKRKNSPPKLKLNRETLRQLDKEEVEKAQGGVHFTALCTIRPGQTSIARTIY